MPNKPVIVAAVDGSDPSKDALRWAARQARLTDSTLHVVTTWEYLPSYGLPLVVPLDADLSGDARKVQDAAIAEVLGDDHGVDVCASVLEGHPAPTLLQQAADASLLVLGSRGHGEFAGMLLGSVSQHCVAHARCPVVVVPAARRPQQS